MLRRAFVAARVRAIRRLGEAVDLFDATPAWWGKDAREQIDSLDGLAGSTDRNSRRAARDAALRRAFVGMAADLRAQLPPRSARIWLMQLATKSSRTDTSDLHSCHLASPIRW